ncbi:MAG: Na+/H+ antiporter NhaC family protein, partial [Gemmatimonadota bacterium]
MIGHSMTAKAIASLVALAASVAPISVAAASAPLGQDEPPVQVRAPAIALTGTGTDIVLTLAEGQATTPFRLTTADGRELARGVLEPGAETALENLQVEGPGAFPLSLVLGERASDTVSIDPLVLPGWLSLVPALVAIALALIFKEVVVSLFFGVWFGALFVAGLNPIAATLRSIDTFVVPALADPDHAAIIVFSALLLGMVGVMGRNGGTLGIVEALSPLATTPRRAQLAAYLGGLAIFFDDYSNTLIVGNTMRPITDRMKVSREKLAYIVDSTAAPVASIMFVSTWVGFQIGLIGDGLEAAAAQPGTSPELAAELLAASPFNVFIQSIPFLFYPILALVMVGLIIWTQRDFGPMWKAENRASRDGGLYRPDAMLLVDTKGDVMEPVEGAPHRWLNAALPVITVFLVVVFGLYFDGRAALG